MQDRQHNYVGVGGEGIVLWVTVYTSDPARDPNQLEGRRRGTRWTVCKAYLDR